VIVVEDSIVRGTTIRNRIEEIREAGAKEIHLRISVVRRLSHRVFMALIFLHRKELIAA
jgi:amidophosphoribosyltransferase